MLLNGTSPVSGNHILADAVTQAQERREQRQQEMVSLIVTQAFELGKIHRDLSFEKTRLTKETVDLKQHIKELEISHQAEILAKEEMIHLKLQDIKELFAVLIRTLNDLGSHFLTATMGGRRSFTIEEGAMADVYNCFHKLIYTRIDHGCRLRWNWNHLDQASVHHSLLNDPEVPPPVTGELSYVELTPQPSFAEEAHAAALPELLKHIVQQIKGIQAELTILNAEKLASSKKISQLNERQVCRIDRRVNYFNNLYEFLKPYEEEIALMKSEGYKYPGFAMNLGKVFMHRVKKLDNPVGATTLRYFAVDSSGMEMPELSNHKDKESVLKAASAFFTHFDVLSGQFFAIIEKAKALRE